MGSECYFFRQFPLSHFTCKLVFAICVLCLIMRPDGLCCCRSRKFPAVEWQKKHRLASSMLKYRRSARINTVEICKDGILQLKLSRYYFPCISNYYYALSIVLKLIFQPFNHELGTNIFSLFLLSNTVIFHNTVIFWLIVLKNEINL